MNAMLKTALIGLGKMGSQYSQDPKISKYYQYSSHLQAITDHPAYDLGALYDHDKSITGQTHKSLHEIEQEYAPDVLVLATPPIGRLDTIREFKNLQAIIMEKPIALDYKQAKAIIDYCEENKILLQINFWRRFDKSIIDLKKHFETSSEMPQAVFMTYGNGFKNNGIHLIDKIRYLFGDIKEARSLSEEKKNGIFPIQGDFNIDFQLQLTNGAHIYAQSLDFSHYREISVDIWTNKRRIEFLQGGLIYRETQIAPHRALNECNELSGDRATIKKTHAGQALYALYDNLHKTIQGKENLNSHGHSALKNEKIIKDILS